MDSPFRLPLNWSYSYKFIYTCIQQNVFTIKPLPISCIDDDVVIAIVTILLVVVVVVLVVAPLLIPIVAVVARENK